MRVGIGYDIHALKPGRRFILGGITIPFPKGPLGHSDGDVLFHAIVDAALGALGEGDIGDHFPDSDPKYRNAASALFVKKVCEKIKRRRLKIAHIDTTVIAQKPRLGGFKPAIRKSVARAFSVSLSQVNIKAKTHEGLDALGKNRAVACLAVVSLKGLRG
ncbi:MAG: 2-C-methyl-D-erythritol 2,4-cyclodiphosphate synthase [Candidatus Omnitrophica bacterium]|nr:2-C-methyl-D-erythritol 2,4-cyclodiphosphate synthase [Candidatus Omnitrophota bacterium]